MASSSPSTSGPPQSTVQAPPLLPQPLDQSALQQLHVHVPPLPSPNTTAAAAALFRVNQLPMAVLSPSPTGPFSFDKADLQRPGRRSRRDEHAKTNERGAVDRHNSDDGTRAVEGADDGIHRLLHRDRIAEHSASMEENEERVENRSGFDDSVSPLLPLSLYAPPGGGGGLTAAGATKSAENVLPHSDLPMSPPGGDVRKRNVGVPKFLRFLFQMLEYEDRSVICWSHKGTAFQIRQPEELARNVLPKYFKHNKVSSFQRQLNYFGFKKWTKTQTNICTFSHPHFIRGEKEKMRLIKRKERSSRTSSDDAKGDAITVATAEILAEDDGSDDPRGREAEPEPERTDSTRVSAKRPRTAATSTGRSPRRESRAKGTPRGATVKKEPTGRRPQSAAVKKRGKAAAAHEPSTSMGKILLPAISSSGSNSTAWASSTSATGGDSGRVGGGGGDTYRRFARETAPASNASSSYSMVDAAPVMPIHSSLLLSHQQQSQQSMARRLTSGGYDGMSMHDFVSANWSPPQQQAAEETDHCPSAAKDSMMMLSAFKYGDSNSLSAAIGLQPTAFDMMEAQSHSYSGQSQASSHGAGSSSSTVGSSRDYLDMLLESATMDEQLSVAAASAAAASDGALGSAWDTSYASSSSSQQQQHAPHSYHHQSHHESHSSMRHSSEVSSSSSGTQPLPSLEDLHSGRY
ncbi:hypothetical protein PINS_up012500 [Pythium insidiosum]|nr:hypothetical protein PINS_up012500 [Pythium insidiosum]